MDDAAEPAPDVPAIATRPAMDGVLRSAISQAIVRIHAEHYGKGATQAKTYVWDNLVVTVLRDVLTTAERTLVDVDRADTVREVRATFQFTMEQTFCSAVERSATVGAECRPCAPIEHELIGLATHAMGPLAGGGIGGSTGSSWPR